MMSSQPIARERYLFWGFALGALALYALSPVNELGDSYHYALAIESGRPAALVEPSHLLWRPLGWLVWQIARVLHPATRPFAPMRLVTILASALSAGGAAVFLDRRIGGLSARLLAVLFAVGFAWWSYATSACAYNLSVGLSLAAMLLVWPADARTRGRLDVPGAMLCQALAVLFWQPAILSSAAVVAAAALGGDPRQSAGAFTRRFLGLGASLGLLVGAVYAPLWLFASSYGPPAIGAWLASGRHGQHMEASAANLARAAYGWTRLFLQPSRLALDPDQSGWRALLNAKVLFSWGLWKTLAIYKLTGIAALVAVMRKPSGTRLTWALLAVWALPHALLGAVFKGADLERWLHAWPAVLVASALVCLGGSPGRFRTRAFQAVLAVLILISLAGRFGPDGSLESRPQVKLLRAVQAHTRRGDLVYLGGELDGGQLNRTTQTAWLFTWVFEAGIGVVDVWSSPEYLAQARFEAGYANPANRVGSEFVSERLLGGIRPGDASRPGTEPLRRELMLRLPPGRLSPSFEAGGEHFYKLLPPLRR